MATTMRDRFNRVMGKSHEAMIKATKGKVGVASNAGQEHAPGWFHNLKANPAASVLINGNEQRVTAAEVPATETDAMWPKLDAMYKGYAGYRKKTSRTIPLVRLTPVAT